MREMRILYMKDLLNLTQKLIRVRNPADISILNMYHN